VVLPAAYERDLSGRQCVTLPAVGATLRRDVPGVAAGLCLGLLALGPGLRRGFLLSYDMVFVPREPFAAALPGLAPPRAVPSGLFVAAVSRVMPADVAQKLVLLAIFVLGCAGVAALLDREPPLARLAGGVFYAWNPYLGERLIIGQWALLLGYAGLPWVLRAVLYPGDPGWRWAGRLGASLVPAVRLSGLAPWPSAACRGSYRRCGTRCTPTPRAWRRSRHGRTRRSAPSAVC